MKLKINTKSNKNENKSKMKLKINTKSNKKRINRMKIEVATLGHHNALREGTFVATVAIKTLCGFH